MRKILAMIVVAAAAVVGWLAWQQTRPRPLVVSGLIEADEIRVGSRVGGRVSKVLVREGLTVKTGDAILEIDPFDLREQLAQAKAQLASDQAELDRLKSGYRQEEIEQARGRRDRMKAVFDKLVAGPRPQELEIARASLQGAKGRYEFAKADYARLKKMREVSDAAAQKEFDEAIRNLQTTESELASAEQTLAQLTEGTRKEEIAAARADLAEAEEALKLHESGYRVEAIAQAAATTAAAAANVAAIEVRLKELTVVSPCDCAVEAIDLRAGDMVAPNAPAVMLLDLSYLWVRAYVPESRLGEIALEQRVPVRVDSYPGERFTGRVTYIAREAEFTPKNVQTPEERSKQVFRIKVTIERGLDRLRVGMAADVLLDEKVGP